MITQFKIFESINNGEPEVGDYVICQSTFDFFTDVNTYTRTTIGELVKIDSQRNMYEEGDDIEIVYMVRYDNVPENFMFLVFKEYGGDSLLMHKQDILYWSKNKKELEKIIDAEKYNL